MPSKKSLQDTPLPPSLPSWPPTSDVRSVRQLACLHKYRDDVSLNVYLCERNRSSRKSCVQPSEQKKSLKVVSKEIQQVPSDMGLLQDTYIHPSFRNQPSPIQEPLSAFKLQWNRIRFKFRDLFSLIILKYSSPKGKSSFGRRELKLNSSIIIPTALALHKQMYSSFAAAETPTLRKICCDGIYDSFRARIASRPRGEQVTWELVKYNRRAKLVGNRAARFPIDGAAVRQAVVRICSTQRLTRARNGVVVGGSGKEKDVVEYVVVQRTYSNWRPGDWQIWGTTRETSLEEVKGWLNRGV